MSTDPRLPPAAAQLKTACAEVSDAILQEALTQICRKPERFSPAAVGIIEAQLKSHRRRIGLKHADKDADVLVVAEQPPANSSTAAIAVALAFLLTSSVYVWMFVRTEGGRGPTGYPPLSIPLMSAGIRSASCIPATREPDGAVCQAP